MSIEQDLHDRINRHLNILGTLDARWALFRANVAEDAASAIDLTGTDLDWSTIIGENDQSGVDGIVNILQSLGPGVNGTEVAFFTDNDEATATFDFEIFAWRSGIAGPGVRLCSTSGNACVIGTQDCQKHPVSGAAQSSGLWCHKITISDHWDGATVVDSNNNRIARVIFDIRGYKFAQVRLFNCDGDGAAGNECNSVGAIISGY